MYRLVSQRKHEFALGCQGIRSDVLIIPGIPAQPVSRKPMAAVTGHGIPQGLVHPLCDQHGVAGLKAGPQKLDNVRAVNVPKRGNFT